MLAMGVDNDVCRRGEAYFLQGRVFELNVTAEEMQADVHGKGGNYRVQIAMVPDHEKQRATFNAICGCPYFAGAKGYCKHIWAVLCFVDGIGGNGVFKSPTGYQAMLHPLGPQARRRSMPTVVSVEPDSTRRIRGLSSGRSTPLPSDSRPPRGERGDHGQRPAKSSVSWREALKLVGHAQRDIASSRRSESPRGTDAHYVIDFEATLRTGLLTVQIFRPAPPTEEGGAPQLVAAPVDPRALENLLPGPDLKILSAFFGAAASGIVRPGQWSEAPLRLRGNAFAVADAVRPALVEVMTETGRFGWLEIKDQKLEEQPLYDQASFRKLGWDKGGPWAFAIAVTVEPNRQSWVLRGEFRRGAEIVKLSDSLADFADGCVIFKDRVAQLATSDANVLGWVRALRQAQAIEVIRADQAAFMRTFAALPSAPELDLPNDSSWKVMAGEPKPKLILHAPSPEMPGVLTANYDFDYDAPPQATPDAEGASSEGPAPVAEREAPPPPAAAATEEPARRGRRPRRGGGHGQPRPEEQLQPGKPRTVVKRNKEREEAMVQDLCAHPGVQPLASRAINGADVFVDATKLSDLITGLAAQGWAIEAEGQKMRVGKSFQIDVTSASGMDWLDLKALFEFGDGVNVQLPKLLDAMRSGKDRVVLSDGSVGLLPSSWMQKLAPVLGIGAAGEGEGSLRFHGSQAAFLDVLVSEAAEARLDKPFAEFREKLQAFSGISQSEPNKAFVGELRPYQCQGLGWLEFLDEFALGGCLADDMGLGKTVQVLAHLQKRRAAAKKKKTKTQPTLIVAPTSLIHNWCDEAQRFTPDLKVIAHRGASRLREAEDLAAYDLVVTSYGTMRSDILMLSTANFDYVVLDEAQAIKNESTQVAQAARTFKCHRRLAMSGTPVENRLSELASLFRFLNPGMIEGSEGMAELFAGASRAAPGRLEALSRMLRPFLLRRTKEQVLPELPGKTENTIFCVLEDEQRKEYDELQAFYRASLTKKVKSEGLAKSRMHVLEALLRLRQLACHPGLIDKKRSAEPSAKLDLLVEQLDEVMASGRKALVFSQFTSLLEIVRLRMEEKGIVYEYLDGSTTDRKERVEHFQTDEKVRVFLISLKAGGVGLNLTAADYCFILDPWWNPATEAQAIDRAHRIGQKNHVFAYRLIARGTVEEKILALQAGKRKLVDGIIANDGDVLSSMTADDLQFLLE